MGTLEIIRLKNHEEASLTLVELLFNDLINYKNYSIGLSGGSTPIFLYQEMVKKFGSLENIQIWTVDERHVHLSSEYSNQAMINKIFSDSKFEIIEVDYSDDPKVSALNYTEKVFSNINKFNAAILGLGDDGHIASLFKGSDAVNVTKSRFVENEVNILTKWRITSTFPLLQSVDNVYLLVTGESKKNILKEITSNKELPVYKLIKTRQKTVLLTDQYF
ncbi:MAG: 6-phosphogluconolactonase [Candidatus Marinimicrobia bacterium]|nr:6-phosphogluconolactonase [Candidatus Neomarinimicrobiota bacterium]MDA1364018.1 6-phosphogluconolactonase [Candidatus Neomarinimicrobiota bacterium]